MIKIYMSPSCLSCRKVKNYFISENIPFEEINILKHEITVDELKEMLNKSLDGTDEIVSTRSKVFKNEHVDIDKMTVYELCEFIKAHPSILKRPIIVDDKKIQVGYNSDEIEIFQKAKKIASETCKRGICGNYEECEHHFKDVTLPCVDSCPNNDDNKGNK